MSPKQDSEKKAQVILDSNALFVPVQFGIDIFEDLRTLLNRNFEPILLSSNRQEIKNLAEKGLPTLRKKASYALRLAERCRLIQVNQEKASPDDIIVKVANNLKCAVFTNDAPLRKRLRDINVPVIYVRQKSHLDIDGRL